ncbi:tyrosine-type recombinase/integrase [Pseudomonas putida]|uniref:tyrosine-type recombinase/integrase n=1 Tax=Pseudomonas putida TaxID=303 RepID=UPI00126037C6|nr:tyrosine-type recombinase/integrase [Pseudomonas putida]
MNSYAIDETSLNKLYKAAASIGTEETQDRNEMVLSVFVHTGANLEEALNLTAAEVMNALKAADHGQMVMIPFPSPQTSKIRHDASTTGKRSVPVPQSTVIRWARYIHTTRSSCIKGMHGDDHGFLLISTKTGKQLTAGSLAAILRELSLAAGLQKPINTRMLRSRFLLNACAAIKRSHGSGATMAQSHAFAEALQWMTGHTRISTLEHYLTLIGDDGCPPSD